MRQYTLVDLMYWTAFLASILGTLVAIEAEHLTIVIALIWLCGIIAGRQFFGNRSSFFASIACAALVFARERTTGPIGGESILAIIPFSLLLGTFVWAIVAGAGFLLSFAKRLTKVRSQVEAILLAMLFNTAICALTAYALRPYEYFCTFQIDPSRAIVLSYPNGLCEGSLPICYHVNVDGKTVSGRFTCTSRACGDSPSAQDFQMFRISDEKVGILERSSEGKWQTIVAHDFVTGQSFPDNAKLDAVLTPEELASTLHRH